MSASDCRGTSKIFFQLSNLQSKAVAIVKPEIDGYTLDFLDGSSVECGKDVMWRFDCTLCAWLSVNSFWLGGQFNMLLVRILKRYYQNHIKRICTNNIYMYGSVKFVITIKY